MTQSNEEKQLGSSVTESRSSTFALRQFVHAAESSIGTRVVDVIKQALETSSINVFGELLDVNSVKALSGSEHEPYLNLLNIFAYGTYANYQLQKKTSPNSLPDLSTAMILKLRQLSIVSLARSRRHIPYQLLLEELGLNNVRELEDIIIDVIYSNVIKGTMDQQNCQLEIDHTIGRDVREEDFQTINNVLGEWCRNCDNILSNIEHQMSTANKVKEDMNSTKQILDNKIAAVKKNLKTPENEDVVMTEVNNVYSRDTSEKSKRNASSKLIKGYKGSNKSWKKDN